jgi:hypothetical protein
LVRARVSSTQNKIVKVRPNKTRSYQVKPIVRLNVHEPRLTVIAPTTPIACRRAVEICYGDQCDNWLADRYEQRIQRDAMSMKRLNWGGISPSRAVM